MLSALHRRDFDAAENLLKAGADPNYTEDGLPLTFLLAMEGDVEGLAFLIRHGADVNCKSPEGATPLHVCWLNDISGRMAKLLIDSGAEVNAINNRGYSPSDTTKPNKNTLAVIRAAGGKFYHYAKMDENRRSSVPWENRIETQNGEEPMGPSV